MVFTDPPYNVPVNGHICGLGKVQHDEFVMASGEMSEEEFTRFLADVTANLAAFSCDGSIHYVCMDWRHMGELLAAGRSSYAELKNLVVWNKDNGGWAPSTVRSTSWFSCSRMEPQPHINNFELGQHGRYRTNVWDYAGVNSLKAERAEELAMHPTVKPVAMVADAIRDCSRRGGIVLDRLFRFWNHHHCRRTDRDARAGRSNLTRAMSMSRSAGGRRQTGGEGKARGIGHPPSMILPRSDEELED